MVIHYYKRYFPNILYYCSDPRSIITWIQWFDPVFYRNDGTVVRLARPFIQRFHGYHDIVYDYICFSFHLDLL
jgi:hypothetical protein